MGVEIIFALEISTWKIKSIQTLQMKKFIEGWKKWWLRGPNAMELIRFKGTAGSRGEEYIKI